MFEDPFFMLFGTNSHWWPTNGGRHSLAPALLSAPMVLLLPTIMSSKTPTIYSRAGPFVLDAALLLKDKRTDIAVLRINTKGEELPIVELSDWTILRSATVSHSAIRSVWDDATSGLPARRGPRWVLRLSFLYSNGCGDQFRQFGRQIWI